MRLAFFLLSLFLVAITLVGFYSATLSGLNEVGGSLEGVVSLRTPLNEQSPDHVASEEHAHSSPPGTLTELLTQAQQMLQHMRLHVRDYTATLVKQERISGKLAPEARMLLKIRNPAAASSSRSETGVAAYLKFTAPKNMQGREVIWVDRGLGSKLVAHETGFLNLMRVELDPQGTLAMLGNKYPITEIGLMRLLEKLIEKIDRGVDLSRCTIEIRDNQQVGDRSCRLVQVTQPRSVPGADFCIAQVFLDLERQVPLRYAAFLWPEREGDPPLLEEEYTYLDLQLNVGLGDADFDPDNAAYDFP
jgi:hypothetical protein